MSSNSLTLPNTVKSLVVILLIISIVFILILGKNIFVPLFLAGLVSIVLSPWGDLMEKWGLGRTSSSLQAVFSAILVIITLVTFTVMQVASFSKDLENVGDRLNNYISSFDSFVYEKFKIETGLGEGLDQNHLIDLLESNSSNIAQALLGTIGSLSSFILLPIFIFFFVLYRGHLTEFIVKVFDKHDSSQVKDEIKTTRKLVQNYILGVMKVMVILAVLNSIVLFSFGIKHAIFFAVFAAILNIIPYLGPLLGAVLPAIFAFLTKDSLIYPIGVIASFQIGRAHV